MNKEYEATYAIKKIFLVDKDSVLDCVAYILNAFSEKCGITPVVRYGEVKKQCFIPKPFRKRGRWYVCLECALGNPLDDPKCFSRYEIIDFENSDVQRKDSLKRVFEKLAFEITKQVYFK